LKTTEITDAFSRLSRVKSDYLYKNSFFMVKDTKQNIGTDIKRSTQATAKNKQTPHVKENPACLIFLFEWFLSHEMFNLPF